MNPTSLDLSSWHHILTMPELTAAHVVASYFSYGDEPNTDLLNQELIRMGKKLVLPRTLADLNLEWISWKDRKSTRLNSSHSQQSRMPSSA